MALNGPIILIEDDESDADVIMSAIVELKAPNKIIHFLTAAEALDYLNVTADRPLMLLCDVRMPAIDGLSLLRQVQLSEHLRVKAIPFIFLSAVDSQNVIDEAYNIGVQGFYVKPATYIALKDVIQTIMVYWLTSRHPSKRFSDEHASRQ
jgi:DNA-binding NarL/FixJ family response regulator